MEPITTAIVTAVATGLTKDAVKAGYEKLKGLIFGGSGGKQAELEAALAGLQKAQADLQQAVTAAGLGQDAEILKQAAALMQEAGGEIRIMGDHNATALNGGKAVVVSGNAGNITL